MKNYYKKKKKPNKQFMVDYLRCIVCMVNAVCPGTTIYTKIKYLQSNVYWNGHRDKSETAFT